MRCERRRFRFGAAADLHREARRPRPDAWARRGHLVESNQVSHCVAHQKSATFAPHIGYPGFNCVSQHLSRKSRLEIAIPLEVPHGFLALGMQYVCPPEYRPAARNLSSESFELAEPSTARDSRKNHGHKRPLQTHYVRKPDGLPIQTLGVG